MLLLLLLMMMMMLLMMMMTTMTTMNRAFAMHQSCLHLEPFERQTHAIVTTLKHIGCRPPWEPRWFRGMTTVARRRLMRDLKKLQSDPPQGISASPLKDDIMKWTAVMFGPDDTPWEGGTFQLEVSFTEEFPTKAPHVKFLTKMFHPNIYNNGEICLDILQGGVPPQKTRYFPSTAEAMSDFSVDFTKSYARRRPEEPRSHYSQRLKFINTLIKGEGDKITDDRIEVLSHCYSNVKYLANVYNSEIMDMLKKYVFFKSSFGPGDSMRGPWARGFQGVKQDSETPSEKLKENTVRAAGVGACQVGNTCFFFEAN
eukprot:s2206_g5.t1